MEYLYNLQNIISIFFTNSNTHNDFESKLESSVTFTVYKDFMTNDIDNIKQLIDNFHTICDNIPNKSIEYFNLPNLTLTESIYSLDILISRPDIMDYLAHNKTDYTEEVVGVISKLYLNIYKIYNINIDNETDIIKQAQLNFDLCEIIIKYTFVFTHPAFSKYFFDLWKYNIKKYYLLAKNNGCLISWVTFSILCPSLANNKCYPIINTESLIHKKINWDYVNSKMNNSYYDNKFKLFIKYYVEK
jgi:hypothetical protein